MSTSVNTVGKPQCTECSRFICPFCEGFGEAHIHGSDMYVTHTKPTCERFDAIEPDAYLRQVNIQYGAHN